MDELEASDVQVWVSNGTYYPDEGADQTDNSRSERFELIEQVRVYGGFHGDPGGETALDARDPYTNTTVLSGEIGTAGMSDNSYHVVFVQNVAGASSVLDGFHIRYGNAVGSGEAGGGGGLLVKQDGGLSGTSPWILRCTFENNEGTEGGAVHMVGAQGSNPIFSNCIFTDNESVDDSEHTQGGAAIYSVHSSGCAETEAEPPGPFVHMYNCLVKDNGLEDGLEAIRVPSGQFDIVNCTIVNNAAGIKTGSSTCTGADIANCIIFGNGNGSLVKQLEGTYTVNYSCVESWVSGGTGNTDDDPDFVNASSDFRLTANSPCIDTGDDAQMSTDQSDLNQNGNTGEKIPDLRLRQRVFKVNSCEIDMGAYEFEAPGCIGDIAGGPNGPDCVIDVDDLLAVINSWGTCGSPCPGDISGGYGCGNGTVDVDDLLVIINGWGSCGLCTDDQGVVVYATMPQSVDDCMDNCSNRYPGGGQDWSDCVDNCVQALCEAEIIECD